MEVTGDVAAGAVVREGAAKTKGVDGVVGAVAKVKGAEVVLLVTVVAIALALSFTVVDAGEEKIAEALEEKGDAQGLNEDEPKRNEGEAVVVAVVAAVKAEPNANDELLLLLLLLPVLLLSAVTFAAVTENEKGGASVEKPLLLLAATVCEEGADATRAERADPFFADERK